MLGSRKARLHGRCHLENSWQVLGLKYKISPDLQVRCGLAGNQLQTSAKTRRAPALVVNFRRRGVGKLSEHLEYVFEEFHDNWSFIYAKYNSWQHS